MVRPKIAKAMEAYMNLVMFMFFLSRSGLTRIKGYIVQR